MVNGEQIKSAFAKIITQFYKSPVLSEATSIKPLISKINYKYLNKMKQYKVRNFILVIIQMMGLFSLVPNTACAQMKQRETTRSYGFEVSAGVQLIQLTSNIASLNELQIDQRGGSIGFAYRKDYWNVKIKPIGFYNSSTETQATAKLIESGTHVNFYPVKYLSGNNSRLANLYFSVGAVRGKYKINGSYLPEGQQTITCIYQNFSTSIISWNVMGGVGIEYQIGRDQQFIIVFAEIKRGLSMATSTDQELFKNTSFKNLTIANIGFAISINQ